MLNPLKFLKKFLKSNNEKEILRINKIVNEVNNLEKEISLIDQKDFPNETEKLIKQISEGKNQSSLLPRAFALVREASKRILNERHFDVQILGGVVLIENKIAEMKTGEGKTLTIVLAAYLNALSKKGDQRETVND